MLEDKKKAVCLASLEKLDYLGNTNGTNFHIKKLNTYKSMMVKKKTKYLIVLNQSFSRAFNNKINKNLIHKFIFLKAYQNISQ